VLVAGDGKVPTFEPHYTLAQAVARFFPSGPLTVASLRNEIRKGRLRATKPAGKLLVTESAIVEMLQACHVVSHRDCTSSSVPPHASPSGSSETERDASAQAVARTILSAPSKP
jgi:hypothetical protein